MIPEHLINELRYIEVRAARRIRTLRIGTYSSRLRGDGFDFDQHRRYTQGEDVRRIDWNATARFGVPFLRQTYAERELEMILAVDLSPSMQFGSTRRTKQEALTLVTASLLFSAVAYHINTGFLAFTDGVIKWTAPVADKGHAWSTLTNLWAVKPRGHRTAVLAAVRHLLGRLKRTTLIFLVSDFVTDEDLGASRELAMLAARHDVVAVVLGDPAETRLPVGGGFVRVRDLESGAELTVGLTDEVRELYARAIRQHQGELELVFYRTGMDHVFVDTQRDVVEPLMEMFERRK